MRTVYLDNNATTAVAPEVFEAMRPFYTEFYGNPSSIHSLGAKPAAAIHDARKTIAAFLGCTEGELTFTSCGTEADNLAIRGICEGAKDPMHIVTTTVEHSAVINVFKRMSALGHELTLLDVDEDGQIDLNDLRASLRENTKLVSIMYANNETGVLFPIDDIAKIVKERKIALHVDAVQAIGKLPLDLSRTPIDMIAMSAHKFHGPKGVGAMYMRRGTRCSPVLLGGGQEKGRRPGTENVAGITAMAKACELAANHIEHYQTVTRRLRDHFEEEITSKVADCRVNGGRSDRLPNTSSICFSGVDGNALVVLLDEVGICASAGSACKSGAGAPSHVLSAMGLSPEEASGSVRFSLSSWTTEEEIAYAIDHIPTIVSRIRESSQQTN